METTKAATLPLIFAALLQTNHAFSQGDNSTVNFSESADCGAIVCFEEISTVDPASGVLKTPPITELTVPAVIEQSESQLPEQDDQESAPAEGTSTGNSVDPSEDEAPENTGGETEQATNVENTARPGLFQVDESAAVRALERSLTQLDALLMPPGDFEIGVDVSFGFNTTASPLIVEAIDDDGNALQVIANSRVDSRNSAGFVDFKMGLPHDTQASFTMPFIVDTETSRIFVNGSVVDVESESFSGRGDFSISLLKGVLTEKGLKPDLLVGFSYNSDSGGTDNGVDIGSGAQELSYSVTATKRQDPLVFSGGLSFSQPLENNGFKSGNSQSISLSALLAASPYTSLIFSVNHVFFSNYKIDGETIDGTGGTSGSYSFGVSSVVGRDGFLSGSLSKGLSDGAEDYSISFGISRRFSLE